VVTTDGDTVFTREDIELGRRVWQSMGGMQLGSIWGHGGYVAPDWSGDCRPRGLMAILGTWAEEEGAAAFEALDSERQAALQFRLTRLMRTNTYDPDSGNIVIAPVRAQAMEQVTAHYVSLFGTGDDTAALREAYAMKNDTVPNADYRRAMSTFFWWTAWAAAAERPGSDITYPNNWPSEPL